MDISEAIYYPIEIMGHEWGVKNFPRILGAIYTGGYIRGYIFCNKTRAPEIFYAFWGEGQKGRFYSGGFKLLDLSEAIYHRI